HDVGEPDAFRHGDVIVRNTIPGCRRAFLAVSVARKSRPVHRAATGRRSQPSALRGSRKNSRNSTITAAEPQAGVIQMAFQSWDKPLTGWARACVASTSPAR